MRYIFASLTENPSRACSFSFGFSYWLQYAVGEEAAVLDLFTKGHLF